VSSVGENVIRLREMRGWTQGDLAQRLGITQPSLWKIEKGTPKWHKVELGTLMKLARALEVPVDDLVSGLDVNYDSLRRDLIRQSGGQALAPHQGRADVPASAQARIRELTTENEDLKNRLAQVQEATNRVIRIVAAYKDREARKTEAGSGKPRRKASR